MLRRFHKMHGLGNDFVVFDARNEPLEMGAARARAIADRKTGVGCDQLIVIEPSSSADVRMRIFNSDGSEVEACGNAARCVTLLLGGANSIETLGGIIRGEAAGGAATVDMGEPRFGWHEIPLSYPMDTLNIPVGWDELQHGFAVNVGNPHIVFFVDDTDAVALGDVGPQIETDPLFQERVNVNIASAQDGEIKLRVWERGAGLTMACGTGACATAVAAISKGLVSSPVQVTLPGGTLSIEWDRQGSIRMSGPGTHVFTGEIEL